MAATAFPGAEIYAADISDDALKVARINVEAYGLSDRIKLVKSDLYSGLAGKRFDLIISNPPYVSADRMRNLPLEFRHEPTLALDGGPDGLSLIRRLVISSRDHMSQNGLLVVETSGHKPVDIAKQFALLQLHWLETSAGTNEVMAIRSVVGQSYEVPKKGKDVKVDTNNNNNTAPPKKNEEEVRSDKEPKQGVGRVVFLDHTEVEDVEDDVNTQQQVTASEKHRSAVSPNEVASNKTYSISNGLHFSKNKTKRDKPHKFSNFHQKQRHRK